MTFLDKLLKSAIVKSEERSAKNQMIRNERIEKQSKALRVFKESGGANGNHPRCILVA
jgi:hypothetical protein